ncbi:MAG TPA: hypothetical protein VFR58_03110 [Flavisolibacter sp.]|nr:hypothetical protein [Flavisolibacter sp.]
MKDKLIRVSSFTINAFIVSILLLTSCKSESVAAKKKVLLFVKFGDNFDGDKINCSINDAVLYSGHSIASNKVDGYTDLSLALYEDKSVYLVIPHIKEEGVKKVPKLGKIITINVGVGNFSEEYRILPSGGRYVTFSKTKEGRLLMQQSKGLRGFDR